jgi:hypothetical protein
MLAVRLGNKPEICAGRGGRRNVRRFRGSIERAQERSTRIKLHVIACLSLNMRTRYRVGPQRAGTRTRATRVLSASARLPCAPALRKHKTA